jgi:hypothetical protein
LLALAHQNRHTFSPAVRAMTSLCKPDTPGRLFPLSFGLGLTLALLAGPDRSSPLQSLNTPAAPAEMAKLIESALDGNRLLTTRQTIGLSGNSSGRHLHYEVRYQGKRVIRSRR